MSSTPPPHRPDHASPRTAPPVASIDDLAAAPTLVDGEVLTSRSGGGGLVIALANRGPTGSAADLVAGLGCLVAGPGSEPRRGPVVAAVDERLGAALAATCAARGRPCIVVVDGDVPVAGRNRIAAFGADLRPCPPGAGPDDERGPAAVAARIAAETKDARLFSTEHVRADDLLAAFSPDGAPPRAIVLPESAAVLAEPLRIAGARQTLVATTTAGAAAATRAAPSASVTTPSRRDTVTAARRAARELGLLTGEEGGAVIAVAARFAETLRPGETVVAVVSGRGARAITTVFDDDWVRRNDLVPQSNTLLARDVLDRKRRAPEDLVTLGRDATVAQAVRIMQSLEVSQIPIVDDEGAIVGTLREDQVIDLLLHAPDGKERDVGSVMDDPLPQVSADASVETVSGLLADGFTAVLVCDDDGRRGILTKYDLIHGLTRAGTNGDSR